MTKKKWPTFYGGDIFAAFVCGFSAASIFWIYIYETYGG